MQPGELEDHDAVARHGSYCAAVECGNQMVPATPNRPPLSANVRETPTP